MEEVLEQIDWSRLTGVTIVQKGERCMELVKGEKHVGLVHRLVDDVRVMNPGKWFASVYTTDDALIGSGPFDFGLDALVWALVALERNWTYEQWMIARAESRHVVVSVTGVE